jgi:arabinofuranan 3-O-arabinosyltransferase
VTLEWTPQRQVWIALAISAAALLLCLFLAFRRRRANQSRPSLDDEPILANPLRASGGMPSRRVLVATVLGTGVLGAVLVRGWVGLLTAALVAAVMFRPRLRWLLTFGAPAALALAGLYTVVQQFRYRYFSTFDWPLHFDRVNDIAWLAVILLMADVVVELARGRSPVASGDPPMGTPPASDPVSNTDPF